MFLLILYCMVMIVLYLAPLGITSPCIMEENQLPPKPALVGHRGAPMVSDQHQQHPGTWSGWMGPVKARLCPARGHQHQTLAAAGLDKCWGPHTSQGSTELEMNEHGVRRTELFAECCWTRSWQRSAESLAV